MIDRFYFLPFTLQLLAVHQRRVVVKRQLGKSRNRNLLPEICCTLVVTSQLAISTGPVDFLPRESVPNQRWWLLALAAVCICCVDMVFCCSQCVHGPHQCTIDHHTCNMSGEAWPAPNMHVRTYIPRKVTGWFFAIAHSDLVQVAKIIIFYYCNTYIICLQ